MHKKKTTTEFVISMKILLNFWGPVCLVISYRLQASEYVSDTNYSILDTFNNLHPVNANVLFCAKSKRLPLPARLAQSFVGSGLLAGFLSSLGTERSLEAGEDRPWR